MIRFAPVQVQDGGPDPCCFNRLFSNLVRRVRRRIRHGRRVNGPRDGAGEDVSFALVLFLENGDGTREPGTCAFDLVGEAGNFKPGRRKCIQSRQLLHVAIANLH